MVAVRGRAAAGGVLTAVLAGLAVLDLALAQDSGVRSDNRGGFV